MILLLSAALAQDTGAIDGAIVEDAWVESLSPDERLALEVVDDAVDLVVDRLEDEGRLKGEGIPWVGFLRDLSKSFFALLTLAIIVRTRRPSIDSEGISGAVVDHVRALFSEREAAQSVDELRLRGQLDEAKLASADLRREIADLQRRLKREEARRRVSATDTDRVKQAGREWIVG